MPSSHHRAGRIDLTILEYGDIDNNAALADLLTDALHWCNVHKKDFAIALDRAKRLFDFEQQLNTGEQP